MNHKSELMDFCAVYQFTADTFIVRSNDGAWLRNNLGSISFTGAGVYDLMAKIYVALDGNTTLGDALIAVAGSDGREKIRAQLLRPLFANQFFRKIDASEVGRPWPEAYHAQLSHLARFSSTPLALFETLRKRSILCRGGGEEMVTVAAALRSFGFARIVLADEANGEGVAAEPRATHEITVLCDSSSAIDRAWREWRDEPGSRTPVAIMATDRGHVLATPVFRSHEEICWSCLASGISRPDPWRSPCPAALVAAALQTARNLLEFLSDSQPDSKEICVIDGTTLSIDFQPTYRRWDCRDHADDRLEVTSIDSDRIAGELMRPEFPSPSDADRSSDEMAEIMSALNRDTHARFGPLYALGEGDHSQFPLSFSAAVLAGSEPGETTRVGLFALSAREARLQAVLAVLERNLDRHLSMRGIRVDGQGIGWSPGEAVYRCRVDALRRMPAVEGPREIVDIDPGRGVSRRRLLLLKLIESVFGTKLRLEVSLHRAADRFEAVARVGAGEQRAIHFDMDAAVDQALMQLLADQVNGQSGGTGSTALLLPASAKWPIADLDRSRIRRLGTYRPLASAQVHCCIIPANPATSD